MSTMHLDIVSAEEEIFSGTVKNLSAAAMMGEVGIFPKHTPMITPLKPGEIKVITEDDEENYASEEEDMANSKQEVSMEKKQELEKLYLKTWKPCILKPEIFKSCVLCCGGSHPYSSLRYCPLIQTKGTSEIRQILKSKAVQACSRCLQPKRFMPARRQHNAMDCPMKNHLCPICVSNKRDVSVASSHSAVMCKEAENNYEVLKKVYEENIENWYSDKLLTAREDLQDLYNDDEMYGNESRPAIENKYESSDLQAYESYCRSAGLDRDNTLGLRTEEHDVEEAFLTGVLDNIHVSLEPTTLGETSLLNSMAFTQEQIKAVERESLGSETEFIEDDDDSEFWS